MCYHRFVTYSYKIIENLRSKILRFEFEFEFEFEVEIEVEFEVEFAPPFTKKK